MTKLFSEEVVGLLDMMLHLADENAKEIREKARSRGHVRGSVTVATLEKQEWDAFKAKLTKRKRLLSNGPASVANEDDDGATIDVDEDDIDMLIALVAVLDHQHGRTPLTISEIARALQRDKVLSVEFTATAREQTKRLLSQLRAMNRAWQDGQGRWALL